MLKPNNKEESSASAAETSSSPPIAEWCRAGSMWSLNDYAECLVPPPQNREYVLTDGKRFYCHHPRHQEIVER